MTLVRVTAYYMHFYEFRNLLQPGNLVQTAVEYIAENGTATRVMQAPRPSSNFSLTFLVVVRFMLKICKI